MTLEEFMRLFHGAVAAVENGGVGEISLDWMEDDGKTVSVYVRREGLMTPAPPAEAGEGPERPGPA